MTPTARPKLIGITGTIGAGKTLVGSILLEADIPVIDTDIMVHQLLAQDGPTKESVIKRFGREICDEHGVIDRRKLGEIVFGNAALRHELELIVHPAVLSSLKDKIAQVSGVPAIAVLAPLLLEANLASFFDEVWTVICDEKTLRERLKRRSNMTDEEISNRLQAQFSQEEKAAKSQRVIDNSGTISDTRKLVTELFDHISWIEVQS